MGRTLFVSNDFPPRRGGIEAFVFALAERFPADEVLVYTARMEGSEVVDEACAYRVIRDRAGTLLPTRRVARRVAAVVAEYDVERVVFGAAAPLGLLAPSLRRAGVRRMVAITHAHEVWWSKMPVARQLLRRIGDSVDVVTYISEHSRSAIAKALSPSAAPTMQRLSPGVDVERFRPDVDGGPVREALGIAADQRVVLSASRLIRRKGQDTLIKAWPDVLAQCSGAVLVILGGGPRRKALGKLAQHRGLTDSVRFVDSVPWGEMPGYYAAANIFALPCRTRLWGFEPEGLPLVLLEAAAAGLPVIVGDSGGAPEAVMAGHTGYVVSGELGLVDRLVTLLKDESAASTMGGKGRQRVAGAWTWGLGLRALRSAG